MAAVKDDLAPRSAAADRLAATIVLGFLVGRLLFATLIGFGVDESYTLAIARFLDWSYFDHPPLHQWIAHFAARALGEGLGARLPFIALFTATGWLLYRLSGLMFGWRAALIALFSFNAAPFFFASAGTWIVPDGPLLFGLTLAAWALVRLLFAPGGERAAWPLWLLAGFAFGIAGLSKYSAALSGLGLVAFVALAPRQRRWFARPEPYVAAALALAMTTPVFLWNARHGWGSFAFQGSRGAAGSGLKPLQFVEIVAGQIAYLSPWLFVPLVVGLAAAFRRADDERRLFLLCLALPAILVFTVTTLWGAPGLPHWTMPGWLFAFPLMGAWLDEKVVSDLSLSRGAAISTGLLAGLVALAAVQAATGSPLSLLPSIPDPTLETMDWRGLRDAPIMQPPPAFVVATRWSDAGKIAMAMGPSVPVYVMSWDPRGWAFVPGGDANLGRDGVIVTRAGDFPIVRGVLEPLFAKLGEPRALTLTRNGEPAAPLTLVPAVGLTRPLPLPYPPAR